MSIHPVGNVAIHVGYAIKLKFKYVEKLSLYEVFNVEPPGLLLCQLFQLQRCLSDSR